MFNISSAGVRFMMELMELRLGTYGVYSTATSKNHLTLQQGAAIQLKVS
jgi:hypothetical protein